MEIPNPFIPKKSLYGQNFAVPNVRSRQFAEIRWARPRVCRNDLRFFDPFPPKNLTSWANKAYSTYSIVASPRSWRFFVLASQVGSW